LQQQQSVVETVLATIACAFTVRNEGTPDESNKLSTAVVYKHPVDLYTLYWEVTILQVTITSKYCIAPVQNGWELITKHAVPK